jgi:hypothetical protein
MVGNVVIGELSHERAKEALRGEKAQIVYSDPPWGEGNLRYWRTHNGQSDLLPKWDTFLNLFCDVVSENIAAGGHVFVEMGLRWVDQVALEMEKRGLPETQRWQCVYTSKKLPNVLWHSGPIASCDPTGMGGVAMTAHVLGSVAVPNALVLDPCCGKGMTARCSVRLGMRFAGVELNPKRGAVTQAWLKARETRKTK